MEGRTLNRKGEQKAKCVEVRSLSKEKNRSPKRGSGFFYGAIMITVAVIWAFMIIFVAYLNTINYKEVLMGDDDGERVFVTRYIEGDKANYLYVWGDGKVYKMQRNAGAIMLERGGR